MLNLQWRTEEQDFMHQRVMMDAKKLDKEQLLDYLDELHKQYQLRHHLFNRLLIWCARSGVTLPSFEELLAPKPINHPTGLE
jgi:hypothetical protein